MLPIASPFSASRLFSLLRLRLHSRFAARGCGERTRWRAVGLTLLIAPWLRAEESAEGRLELAMVKLDAFVIEEASAASVGESILPTRPVNTSLYGFDTTVQNSPRSIQQISPQQLKNDLIANGQDLARYAPGLSRNFANGTASAPYIRGQTPDQYQNGIRVDRGGTTIPFSNNAIESVDLVAGPASSIFGPSASTSGYVNYITKKPYFDRAHTELRLEFGDYRIEDQSSGDFRQTLDTGGPLIAKTLAYRFSVQGREGKAFHGSGDARTSDPQNHIVVFGALTWLPKANVIVDTNVQYNNFHYASTRGFNRVTQDLIDNRNYLSGAATPILRKGNLFFSPTFTGRTDANPTGFSPIYRQVVLNGAIGQTRSVTITDTPVPTSTISQGASPGAQSTAAIVGYVFEPQNVSLQKIKQNRGYTSGDQQDVRQWQGQNRILLTLSDDWKIRNTLYAEALLVKSAQLARTTGTVQDDSLFDDRIELIGKKEFRFFGRTIEEQSNTGLELRYNRTKSFSLTLPYTDASDLFDPRTITSFGVYGKSLYDSVETQTALPAAYINAAFGDVTTPARLAAYPVPGYSGYRTGPANSIFANTTTVGLYSQHEFNLGEKWTWIAGTRASLIDVKSTNPVVPVTGQPVRTDHSATVLPAANTSLLYKPAPSTTTYATFAYTQALNANDAPTLVNGELGTAQFHSASFLYEAGAKFEFVPNQWYGTIAGFYQERALAPQQQVLNGVTSNITPNIHVKGIEASLQYQPGRHWSAYANFTWIDSHYIDYLIFSNKTEGPNIAVGTQTDAGVVGLINQDQGNAAWSQRGRGNYRESLIPRYIFNLGTSYQTEGGWGVGASFWLWGSWRYFILSDIVIPAQHNLDLSVFYAPPKANWEVRVAVTNVTNQWNFQPNGAENVNDFISPLPPLGLRAAVTLRL